MFVASLRDTRSAFGERLGTMAARMAEVVTAAAAAPVPRTWTPKEVEQAREDWLAVCDSTERKKLKPGPLLDTTRGGLAEFTSVFGGITETLRMKLENGEEN